MLKTFITALIIYSVIVAAYTLPELAPLAQAITYVLWPFAVVISLVFIFGRDQIARKEVASPASSHESHYSNFLWPFRAAALVAIAYSGRPALAAVVFFFFLTAGFVTARIKELRAEQAQQDQPAPQVKCPGHR